MVGLIETQGALLRLDDTGVGPSSGPALLFLHYWGGSARTWRKVIGHLPGIRCIAVNQRGWGGSTARDGRYDLDAMAADVVAVIRRLGLPEVVLVGHSMGGKVAQVVAMRRCTEVRGLVLVAPGPPTAMPVPAEVREAMLASYQTPAGVDDALANLAGPKLTPDERESVRADTLAGEPGAKEEWPRRGMIADLGLEPGNIGIPVTLLVGSLDKVERPDHQRAIFGAAVPQARFIEIPGVGHLSPLEAPDEIASACRDMAARVDAARSHLVTSATETRPMTHVANPEDFPKAFEQALNSGDLDRIGALYDEGATLRTASGEVGHGTQAVLSEMQNLVAAKAHITNTLRQVLRSREVALIIVDYVLQIDTPDGRAEMHGTATNVIRDVPGKGWRMIIANPQGVA